MSINITKKQQAVLDYLRACIATDGYPPTVFQISHHFGWASDNAAQTHLIALQKKGFINLARGRTRGISIVGESIPDAVKMAQALRVMQTWARTDIAENGRYVLTPFAVLRLCEEALA